MKFHSDILTKHKTKNGVNKSLGEDIGKSCDDRTPRWPWREKPEVARTRPLSTCVVSMTTMEEPCSQVICQKSGHVLGSGPWHAI